MWLSTDLVVADTQLRITIMIISPPFLPDAGLAAPTGTDPDPMMDTVDKFEYAHGIYPIAFDRHWHCGVHLQLNTKGKVYAIADGEVVAYGWVSMIKEVPL
ncbi:hypothetical protein [Burkholderia pyrrocinia]|uniref:hypothetical protein n=1 Tax=Burkholderia pyrrocinia TaxID=60550 RepID=UPI0014045DFB|nr:hypothetical protein [Burkholderia pyrrocinia]